MRVLVTGGAGYIGSHCARVLARRGHEVVIIDNLSTGHEFLAQGFKLLVGDIGDEARVTEALDGVDAVMHFAAHSIVPESVTDPAKYFDNNVRKGLVLLNAARKSGVGKFIFSSTAAVYGIPDQALISEDAPQRPVNPYGLSKLSFEHALEAYDQGYGLRYMSLRYFNAAGADENGEIGELHNPETHLIPNALAAAAGLRPELQMFGDDYPTPDGTCVRDYIHVSDLADAHALALESLDSGGASAVLNLGTGKGSSVREVLTAVQSVTGKPLPVKVAPRRPGDPATLVADPTRAQSRLGWKASRSLKDMIASSWAFFQVAQTSRVRS
ncbi:MAG: UDP-glucose 4-epimerase GalE [Candidatus Korobacteraceae bacterium]